MKCFCWRRCTYIRAQNHKECFIISKIRIFVACTNNLREKKFTLSAQSILSCQHKIRRNALAVACKHAAWRCEDLVQHPCRISIAQLHRLLECSFIITLQWLLFVDLQQAALCSVLLTRYYAGRQIKKSEMGWACNTYRREEKCIQGFHVKVILRCFTLLNARDISVGLVLKCLL
jgi:hypothetical protein